MSMSPMVDRPGTKGDTACDVLASTFCPIRVRLKLRRAVLSVDVERTSRYSPVKNWLREMKVSRKLRIVRGQELPVSSNV